jgi:hypothetical protein
MDEFVERVVTCHTHGCGNGEIPIPLPVENIEHPSVQCGVCGQFITDIKESA